MVAKLRELPTVDYTYTTIGEAGSQYRPVTEGTTYVKLKSHTGGTFSAVLRAAREKVEQVPGLTFGLTEAGAFGQKPIQISVRGPEIDELDRFSRELVTSMRQIPGVADIENSLEKSKPELRVERQSPARERPRHSRLDHCDDDAGGVVGVRWRRRLRTRSATTTTCASGCVPDQRRFSEDLLRLSVPTDKDDDNSDKILKPLSEVATVHPGTGPSSIRRRDLVREVRVSANTDGRPLQEVSNDINAAAAKLALPPGYDIVAGGDTEELEIMFRNMFQALLLAVIFIYLILASQFGSFTHPLAIMLSLPLSLVGVAVMLYFTHDTLNIMSMIGLIMLMGLVTKNAILLVDFTNQGRREGLSRHQALLQAGTTRLRPIVMTTLAMIFGMLPLAFAIGAGAEMRAPMARAVIGGLITSTLLSLLVVPVVYTFLDDFRPSILWSWMGWFRRSPAVPKQDPAYVPAPRGVGKEAVSSQLFARCFLLFALCSRRLVSYGYAMKFVVAIGLGLLLFAAPSYAQLQQGTIVGSLVGPSGTSIGEAQVTLFDQLGNAVTTVTATNGQFRLTNVAIGSYSLRAEAAPFEAVVQSLTVVDALPITLELKLSAALAEQVNVTAETNQPVTTATRTTLAGDAVRRAPIRISSRGLQDAIATTPGWSTEDNGLMHARGVDDGFLYVVDGMPLYERMDSAHGIAPDPEMVESINVLVGHVPPEFGFKSGGVIEVRTSSRKSESWLGNLQTSTGSDATYQGSAVVGGPLSRSTALTFGFSGQSSDRFLDPVHPDNLHNSGNAANGTAEFSWLLSPAEHAVHRRRRRTDELRGTAQRGSGSGGPG